MGNEDLSPHPFTRAFVERIRNDADDFDCQLRLAAQCPSRHVCRSHFALEEVLGEALVDDRDGGLLFRIQSREVAPLEQRNLHRREVAGRQRVDEGLHVLVIPGLMPFHPHRAVPLVAGEDGHGGEPGRNDPRSRPQPLEGLLVEVDRSRRIVSAEGRRQPERHEIVERDSGVCGLQVLQAPHEEARAEEQQEAEGDLGGDEALSQKEVVRPDPRSHRRCPSVLSTDPGGLPAVPGVDRR